MVKLFSAIFLIVFLSPCQSQVNSSLRLPRNLVPLHYLLRLQPFINGNFSINGHVDITFNVTNATNKIILHIRDILTKNETTQVRPLNNPSSTLTVLKQEFDPSKQFYIATLQESLMDGHMYNLSLDFEGYLNDDMAGFYRSTYKDINGKTVTLAASDFEPTQARKAFPCFDEPNLKAKFTIEIAREAALQAISNMPRKDAVPLVGQDGWLLDRFDTTFPMSTYLVAFMVSDFASIRANDTDKYFRVWARKEAISSAEYALKLAPPITKYYENFFNVSFPLPKQDMIALPDFASGGMENWGLIAYRESALLYDPTSAKAKDKMRIASVISHELAHMWFGDLVSPAWWTDLWLNEGFASYMEHLVLVDVEPSMSPLEQFVITELYPALNMDSLESSHPVWIEVSNPDEINEIFDDITYSKGASIIRMMSGFLTENTFRHGLRNYLTELAYSNANQDDLWKYLTIQAHLDGTFPSNITVKDVMDTWTLQMGYPVVTVKRNLDGTATLTQARFLLNMKTNLPKSKQYKWWIPISFTTQENPNFEISKPSEWLTPNEDSKTISGLPNVNKWVIFNVGQTGFYRVTYDGDNWDAIASQLQKDNTIINVVNRAQIVDDVMNLARVGIVNYDRAFSIVSYLKYEKEFVPIKAALDNLAFIKGMLSYSGGFGLFKNYLLSIIVPLYHQIGFTDKLSDPFLDQLKRAEILQWACELEYPSCISSATELFLQWMQNPEQKKSVIYQSEWGKNTLVITSIENLNIISPNLKSVVFCTAIREGNESMWKFAWDQYEASSVGTEKKEILEALTCTRSTWILSEFLNRSLTGSGIRKDMVNYIFPAVAKTEIGRFVAWQFIRNNWNAFVEYFGQLSFTLFEVITSVTENQNTVLEMQELQNFKSENTGKLASARQAVDQALEKVEININWMSKYYDVIVKYLKDQNYDNII